jgi:gluconate 5-dehydrogenase
MAQALAEAGADLILVGRDGDSLTAARDELSATGRSVESLVGDVGEPAGAERVCAEALTRGGPIDVLVNNVGGRRIDAPTEDLPLADWQRILDLNLTSAFVLCQRLGRGMLERGRGSIINVSSIAATIVSRGIGGRSYETAKAALSQFTRALAADWAPRGVRVNAIAPGVFETDPNKRWFGMKPDLRKTFLDLVPMGRFGEPSELGPLAVYLASDASSYMTGATLVIDGGYTLW